MSWSESAAPSLNALKLGVRITLLPSSKTVRRRPNAQWTSATHGLFARVAEVHCGLATLHDLVGVTAGAKHRNECQAALLLKKASAWHEAWESAHLKHDLGEEQLLRQF